MRSAVIGALIAVAACQRGGDKPAPASGSADPAYTRDIERVCDARRLAGIEGQPGTNPQLVVAQWLDGNLETAAARDFLAKMSAMDGAAKVAALDAEAARVGLTAGCALAREWASSGR
jgi:hypothetical protein